MVFVVQVVLLWYKVNKISFGDLPSANERVKGLLESTYPGRSIMVAITRIVIVSIQYMVGVLLVVVRKRMYDFYKEMMRAMV